MRGVDRAVSGPALALCGAGSGDRESCWHPVGEQPVRELAGLGLPSSAWESRAGPVVPQVPEAASVFSRWDTSTTLRGSVAYQCVRYGCLPGWRSRQQLWGLLLCRGWVMLRGSSTHSETPCHPLPTVHAPWARSQAVRGAAGRWAHTWLSHACEPPRHTPAPSPSSV